jgi:hypothetical protein
MNDAQIMKGGVCKKVNAKAKGVFCNCKPTSNARGWDVAYLSPIMVSFPVIEYIMLQLFPSLLCFSSFNMGWFIIALGA